MVRLSFLNESEYESASYSGTNSFILPDKPDKNVGTVSITKSEREPSSKITSVNRRKKLRKKANNKDVEAERNSLIASLKQHRLVDNERKKLVSVTSNHKATKKV